MVITSESLRSFTESLQFYVTDCRFPTQVSPTDLSRLESSKMYARQGEAVRALAVSINRLAARLSLGMSSGFRDVRFLWR